MMGQVPMTEPIQHTRTRQNWDDGTFTDVSTLHFPAQNFAFAELEQRERTVKLSQITHLYSVKARARGVTDPRIVAFARLERDRAASETFPGIDPHTESGEQLYSANSLITYTLRTLLARGWLRYDGGEWLPTVPDAEPRWRDRARAVLALLACDERLYLGGALGHRRPTLAAGEDFDIRRCLAPVDRLGFLREFVWRERPRVAFNASYFLLEHDDFFSHHSALGESYNLYVRDGAVLRPPLYRRAAFYQSAAGRWQTGYFSLADVSITLPGGIVLVPQGSKLPGLSFSLDPGDSAEVAVYTRASGLKTRARPLRHTPTEAKRIEFTIVDTRIVGRKTGGGLDIPQNGLVLSFAPGALPPGAIPGEGLPGVQYGFASQTHHAIRQAIQVGPMLLRGGQIVTSPTSLADEQFWPTPLGCTALDDAGIVPTDYPDDVDRTRAGRIGLGVDSQGRLIVVAAPSAERGTHIPGVDSHGATLAELAGLLAQAGVIDAINLDGGGSTHLFFRGGLVTPAGGRYGMPGVHFERMTPTVGVLE